MFFGLPESVDSGLAALGNTHSRCVAALLFASKVRGEASSMGVNESELSVMRIAYLRAALMEYVGMEEVLPIDLRGLPTRQVPTTIWGTENPMLILVRELRNIQLHLVNSELIRHPRKAYLKAKPDQLINVSAHTILEADLDKLTISKNAKQFNSQDFAKAVAWLKCTQLHWGIADVVIESIWEFARRIVVAHTGGAG